MVGSFGKIDESSRHLQADCGWGARYRNLDLAGITLRTGRDVLAVDAELVKMTPPVRLPGMPKRTSDGKLWIPASHAEPIPTPPILAVGFRRVGRMLRIRCGSPIRFLPGVIARVNDRGNVRNGGVASQEIRVLVELDGSNPAAVAAQLRRLIEIDLTALDDLRRAIGDPNPAADTDGLSPAAETILSTIQSRPPGTVHELEFIKRGAEKVIETLVDRGFIRRLSSGQVVDESRFQGLWTTLASGALRTTSRAAARLWGTSHGFALAVLEEMVNDGLVNAKPGKEYWIDL